MRHEKTRYVAVNTVRLRLPYGEPLAYVSRFSYGVPRCQIAQMQWIGFRSRAQRMLV